MNLANVMQAVADRLDTITGLRVTAFPPATVVPPAAYVDFPDSVEYDQTYGRGSDLLAGSVVVVVGKASLRTARDRLLAYTNGTGASSFKAVLESGAYTAFDSLTVTGVKFGVYQIAATDYLAAVFTLNIVGSGS